MVDRVQPLKQEGADTGGTQTDLFPTAVNRNEDYLDARGVTHQNGTSDDDAVRTGRDASDNLTLQDPVTGVKTLAQLAASAGGDAVKVSANDTTADFLENKVVAGPGITIDVLNEGADEDLRISAGAIRKANVPVTTDLQFSGGPVDGSDGGFTAGPDDVGEWLFMFEGWADGTGGTGLLKYGLGKNALTFIAGTEREIEIGFLDGIAFVTSAFITLADGDVVYGLGKDIGAGQAIFKARRLIGVKLS